MAGRCGNGGIRVDDALGVARKSARRPSQSYYGKFRGQTTPNPMRDYSRSPMTAVQVLKEHWNGALPIGLAHIAESMGIRLYKRENPSVIGEASFDPDGNYQIIIDPNQSKPRRRFTVAHEIGHIALGHLRRGEVNSLFRDKVEDFSTSRRDSREVAANKFAAELLMPAELVRTAFQKMPGFTVQKGAEIFGVSEAAMGYRLMNLGLMRD